MTASLTSKVAIVGLGYAGLPLAMAFSKVLQTIGFDINKNRITELKNGPDRNGEMAMKNVVRRAHHGRKIRPLILILDGLGTKGRRGSLP
jgi:UDP-N-acetyl-D-mannosaminuronate dehydrogenase